MPTLLEEIRASLSGATSQERPPLSKGLFADIRESLAEEVSLPEPPPPAPPEPSLGQKILQYGKAGLEAAGQGVGAAGGRLSELLRALPPVPFSAEGISVSPEPADIGPPPRPEPRLSPVERVSEFIPDAVLRNPISDFAVKVGQEAMAGLTDLPRGSEKIMAPESTGPQRLEGVLQTVFGLPRAVFAPVTATVTHAYDTAFDALPDTLKDRSVTLPYFGETTVRQISESFGKPLAVNLAFLAMGKFQLNEAELSKATALRESLKRQGLIEGAPAKGAAVPPVAEVPPRTPGPAEISAQAFDEGLTQAERLRQSPKGAALLRGELVEQADIGPVTGEAVPPRPGGEPFPAEPAPPPQHPTLQAAKRFDEVSARVREIDARIRTIQEAGLPVPKDLRREIEAARAELSTRSTVAPETPPPPPQPTIQPQGPPTPRATMPPELQGVVDGSARAFLRPPAAEGNIPTAGEQAIRGMDLRTYATDNGLGYYKARDKTEVLFNREQITPSELKALDKQGKIAEVVNGPGTAPKPAAPTEAVTARTPEGTEIRTVLTETPEQTKAAVEAQPTTARVEVTPAAEGIAQTLKERAATQPPPAPSPAVSPAPSFDAPSVISRLKATGPKIDPKYRQSVLETGEARLKKLDTLLKGEAPDFIGQQKLRLKDESNRRYLNVLAQLESDGNATIGLVKDKNTMSLGPWQVSTPLRKELKLPDNASLQQQASAVERRIAGFRKEFGDDIAAVTTAHWRPGTAKAIFPKGQNAPVVAQAAPGTSAAVPEQPIEATVSASLSARERVPPEAALKEVELHAGIPIDKDMRARFGRAFVPNYKYDSEMIAALRERRGELAFSQEKAVEASRSLSKGLTKQQRVEAGAALKGQGTLADAATQAKVEKVRADLDSLSQQIKAEGLLPEKTIDANLGKYTRRNYLRDILGDQWAETVRSKHPDVVQEAKDYLLRTQKIKGQPITDAQAEDMIQRMLQPKRYGGTTIQGVKPIKIDQSPLKQRQDIPIELRRLMGEVEDGGYLAGRTMLDQSSLLINKRFFDRIGKGHEMLNGQEVPWFRDTPAEGYSQFALPDSPIFGAVRKKYVLQKYEGELTELTRVRGDIERLYERAYSTWKTFKTVDNPATHGRNVLGSIPFADFAGISTFNPLNIKFYRQSVHELIKGGAMRDEALRHQAIGTEYATAELRLLANELGGAQGGAIDGLFNFIEKINRPVAKLYNAEDQVFKLASYIKQRSLGMAPTEASAHVNKWFPNSAEVGPAVKALRTSPVGAPFISFTAEAARIYANALREHPIKLFKWAVAVPGGMTAYAAAKHGMSFEDVKELHASLPESLRRKYLVLLPMKDQEGNLKVWDISYTLPLADTFGARGLPYIGNVVLSHPFVNTLIQVAADYNFATKRPITEPGTGRRESATKFVLQQALPPLTPGVGYGAERIGAAVKGEPRQWPYSDVETVGEAATRSLTPFGAIPLTEGVQQRKRAEDAGKRRDLEQQWHRVKKDRSLSEEERTKRLEYLREQARQLRSD